MSLHVDELIDSNFKFILKLLPPVDLFRNVTSAVINCFEAIQLHGPTIRCKSKTLEKFASRII